MKGEFTTNVYSGYMYGDNLAIKIPPDFHNYTGLNKLVNSFL